MYFLYRLVELILETDLMCLEFIHSLLLFNLSPLFPSVSLGHPANLSVHIVSLSFPVLYSHLELS